MHTRLHANQLRNNTCDENAPDLLRDEGRLKLCDPGSPRSAFASSLRASFTFICFIFSLFFFCQREELVVELLSRAFDGNTERTQTLFFITESGS